MPNKRNDLPVTSNASKRKYAPSLMAERNKQIKRLYFETKITQYKLAEKFGLCQSRINRILSQR